MSSGDFEWERSDVKARKERSSEREPVGEAPTWPAVVGNTAIQRVLGDARATSSRGLLRAAGLSSIPRLQRSPLQRQGFEDEELEGEQPEAPEPTEVAAAEAPAESMAPEEEEEFVD